MRKKLLFIFATIACIGFVLKFSVAEEDPVNTLLLENIEAIAQGEGGIEYPAGYSWSFDIDCPGWFTGDYNVCEENGPGLPCPDPGAKTCQCGVNC